MSKEYFPYEISFRVSTEECRDNMLGLIKLCEALGILGASRTIGVIEEGPGKWSEWFFDGDGNHKISFIKTRG